MENTDLSRRRLKISLITLVVVVSAAAFLAWMNFGWTTRRRLPSEYVGGSMIVDGQYKDVGFFDEETAPTLVCKEQGWPLGFYSTIVQSETAGSPPYVLPTEDQGRLRAITRPSTGVAIATDAALAIYIIGAAGAATEILVRRRRKKSRR